MFRPEGSAEIIPSKRFACPVCPAKYLTPQELQRHLPEHTDDAKRTCPTCGRSFEKLDSYKKHLVSHTGGYTENIYSDVFTFFWRLRHSEHNQCVSLVLAVQRNCFCTWMWRASCPLLMTGLFIADVRNYMCGECESSFKLRSSLRSHLKNRHG